MLAVTLHVSNTAAVEAFALFGVHLPSLTRESLFPVSEKSHIWNKKSISHSKMMKKKNSWFGF